MGREMGGRFKREGIFVYLWLIHVEVWQKITKFCKPIILQLKKLIKKKKNQSSKNGVSMETTQEEAVLSRKWGRGKTWTQSRPQAQTWRDGSEVLGGTVFPELSPEAPHTRRRGAAPHWWPQVEKPSIPFYDGPCILFLNIMETHAFNLSQENTNFTNHFWNVLSSRFQSITHKLSLLTKLYCSHLLTICSQSCYALKVEMLAAQLCLALCDPVDRSPPGGSGHGILQARILELTATAFSRGSSQPRGWTQVSRIADRFFTVWGTHYLL